MINNKSLEDVREYFLLSQSVYKVSEKHQVGDWVKRDDLNLSTATQNSDTGFKSAIFQNKKGDVVVAFAGTDTAGGLSEIFNDVKTDLLQGLGFMSTQYRQAASLAREVVAKFSNSKITYTGHSLGGGLAATASAVTGKPAITINPAGVHRNTLKREGIDPQAFKKAAENGLVTRYVVKGEILDRFQSLPLIVEAQGHKISFDSKQNTFAKHKVSTAIDALDAKVKIDKGEFVQSNKYKKTPLAKKANKRNLTSISKGGKIPKNKSRTRFLNKSKSNDLER